MGKIDYRDDGLGMDYRWLLLDLLENTDAAFLESFLNLSLAIAENIFSPMLNGYWQDNIAGIEDSLEDILNDQIVTEMVWRVKYRAKFKNTRIHFQRELPDFKIEARDSVIQLSTNVSIEWLTHIYVEAWVLNPNPFHWGYIWKDIGDADGIFNTNINILANIGLHGKGVDRRLQIDTVKIDAATESDIDWSALGIDFTWETLSNFVENLIDDQLESLLTEQLNSDSLAQPYYLSDLFKSLFPNEQVPTQKEILDQIFEYEKPFIRNLIRPGDFTRQYWSIGYEPNFFPFMSPEQYAEYFTKYYRYIKSHDPDAKILGPSILLTELMENPEQIVFSYIPPLLWGFLSGVEDEFTELIQSYIQKTDCKSWFQRFIESLDDDIQIDVLDIHVFPLATRFQDINWDSVASKIDSFALFASQLTQTQEIWVTEFGNIDHRRSENEAVAICLNLCDYFKDNSAGIARWFWYLSRGHSPFYDTDFSPDPPISALLNSDLSLTKIGRAYLNKADNTPPIMRAAPKGKFVAPSLLIFSWDEAIELDTGIDSYQLQVKEINNEVIEYNQWVGNRLSVRLKIFRAKTMVARVRAKNGAGLISDWSPWSEGVLVLPRKEGTGDILKLADDSKLEQTEQVDVTSSDIQTSEAEDLLLNSEQIQFKILKNYPNPFNSATTIQFQLTESSEVKVSIYNSLGQLIRILIHRYESAGTHNILWDGFDSSGRAAVSGIYFCQVEAEGTRRMRKITLLR